MASVRLVSHGAAHSRCNPKSYFFSSIFSHCPLTRNISQTFWHRLPIFQVDLHCVLHRVATSSCRGHVDEPFLLLHGEHGTGYRRSWNCCDWRTCFVVIWKHSVYGHQDMDWLCDAPSSFSRGRNTSASVTVRPTVTVTYMSKTVWQPRRATDTSANWRQSLFCCCTASMEQTTDRAETAAIDGLVSSWSENIFVSFCPRAPRYGLTLWCAIVF